MKKVNLGADSCCRHYILTYFKQAEIHPQFIPKVKKKPHLRALFANWCRQQELNP